MIGIETSDEEEDFNCLECVDECLSGGEEQQQGCGQDGEEPFVQPPTSSHPERSDYNEYLSPSPPDVASMSKDPETESQTLFSAAQQPQSFNGTFGSTVNSIFSSTGLLGKDREWGRPSSKQSAETSGAGARHVSKPPSVTFRKSRSKSKDTYSSSSSPISETTRTRRLPRTSSTYTKKKQDGCYRSRRVKQDGDSYRKQCGSRSRRRRPDADVHNRISYGRGKRSISPPSAPNYSSTKRSFADHQDNQDRERRRRTNSRITKSSDRSPTHLTHRHRASLSPESQKERTHHHMLVSPRLPQAVLLSLGNACLEKEDVQDGSWRLQQRLQPRQSTLWRQPPIQSWRLTPGYRGTSISSIYNGPAPPSSLQHFLPGGQLQVRRLLHPFHPVPPAQMSHLQATTTPRTSQSSFWKSGTPVNIPSASAIATKIPLPPPTITTSSPNSQLKTDGHPTVKGKQKQPGKQKIIPAKSAASKTTPAKEVLGPAEENPQSSGVKSELAKEGTKPTRKEPESIAEVSKAAEEQPKSVIEGPKEAVEQPAGEPVENMDAQEANKAVHELFASPSSNGEAEQKRSRDYLKMLKLQFPDLGVIGGQSEDSDLRGLLASATQNCRTIVQQPEQDPMLPLSRIAVDSPVPASPAGLTIAEEEEEEPITKSVITPGYLSNSGNSNQNSPRPEVPDRIVNQNDTEARPKQQDPPPKEGNPVSSEAALEQQHVLELVGGQQAHGGMANTRKTSVHAIGRSGTIGPSAEAADHHATGQESLGQQQKPTRQPEMEQQQQPEAEQQKAAVVEPLPEGSGVALAPAAKEQQSQQPNFQPEVGTCPAPFMCAPTPTCSVNVAAPVPPSPVKFNSPHRKSKRKSSLSGTARLDPRVKKTSLGTLSVVVVKEEPREEGEIATGSTAGIPAGVHLSVGSVSSAEASVANRKQKQKIPRMSTGSSSSSGSSNQRELDPRKYANNPLNKHKDLKVKFKPLMSSAGKTAFIADSQRPLPCSSTSLNSQHFPDMHESVLGHKKIRIAQISDKISPAPVAPVSTTSSFKETVFTVGPDHPDGKVFIQPALADISLPPQPPAFLRNAPTNSYDQGEMSMDISDGELESSQQGTSEKRVMIGGVSTPQSGYPPASPAQDLHLQSPRISEGSSCSSTSKLSASQPRVKETSYEAIENRIRNQLKARMKADFEVQFNSMKANYKGQIDQFVKQIVHLEGTLKQKEHGDKREKDSRVDALLAEKSKLEGIINGLRTTLSDNHTLFESLQSRHADQLMAKEQEMRDREKEAVTRYLAEQNRARKLETEVQELRKRIRELEKCSDESTKLEEENCRLRVELEESVADNTSLQTVLEEAQMQLEADKSMLKHAEDEYERKLNRVNKQNLLDKQEIAVWKQKHESLEEKLKVPQITTQTMTTFTLASEEHLRKCVDETMEMKWKLTQICQEYKQKIMDTQKTDQENKEMKAKLEVSAVKLMQAECEVVKLQSKIEDSEKKLEYEINQASQISFQMLEMEQKLNAEKVSVCIQTDIVQPPAVKPPVEQNVPPVDPVLSRPSSTARLSQTTPTEQSSWGRKRSHLEAGGQHNGSTIAAPAAANESDDDIIFEKTVKPVKKLRTKSVPKISTPTVSVKDIVVATATSTKSAIKVPKRDVSETFATPDEAPESSSSPAVLIDENNTTNEEPVTSPDSSSSALLGGQPGNNASSAHLFLAKEIANKGTQAASPNIEAVPQVFALDDPDSQATTPVQPLHVQTAVGSSARASPSFSDASTVSPSSQSARNVSSSASRQARHPLLTLAQQTGQRYNLTGFKASTKHGVVPNAPVNPLKMSAETAGVMANPMQDPQMNQRFHQLFAQEHQGETSALQPQQRSIPPTAYVHNQQLPPPPNNNSSNSQSLKVIAEANRVLEAFFAFLLVHATHQPACCVLLPFCNSYNIPEKERPGLLAQLEPLARLYDQMKVENLETLKSRHRNGVNRNV